MALLYNIPTYMKKCDKVLIGFEAKAQKIIHKYTLLPQGQPVKYGYLRLSGFFGNFNNAFRKLDEELSRESLSTLSRFINNDDVDFVNLVEGLHHHRLKAKMEFIQKQQPLQSFN